MPLHLSFSWSIRTLCNSPSSGDRRVTLDVYHEKEVVEPVLLDTLSFRIWQAIAWTRYSASPKFRSTVFPGPVFDRNKCPSDQEGLEKQIIEGKIMLSEGQAWLRNEYPTTKPLQTSSFLYLSFLTEKKGGFSFPLPKMIASWTSSISPIHI